jgi:probable O-glycosylation ligase (exosortase A-associated)
MRDIGFTLVLLGLLPLAAIKPFVGVILWCWISFMNPHQTLWGFASSMPWAMVIFCVTVLGCLVGREPRRISINAVNLLLVLFLLCVTLTSLTAQGNPVAVWNRWEWVAKIILGLLLISQLVDDRQRIHAVVWMIVIALGYYGVRGGAFTLLTGGGYIVLGPPGSVIGDRNQLATALLIALPLMNYLRLHSRHRLVRIGLVAAMALTLFSVVGSQSRGALVGLVATAAIFWLRSPGKIVSGIALAIGAAALIAYMPESWWARMHSIDDFEQDSSAMGRINIWLASWEMARANPLTGAGFMAMYQQAVVDRYAPGTAALAAHSIWFEVLGEHGFPTFFVWFSIILAGGLCSLRIEWLARGNEGLRWARDLARMSQVSIVAYCSAGSLLSLSYWDVFWTLMVVLAATLTVCHATLREEANKAAGRAPGAGWRQRALAGRPVAARQGAAAG